ncbi:MAG: hypothetical protein WCH31_09425 [Actinomycetes bacterium]
MSEIRSQSAAPSSALARVTGVALPAAMWGAAVATILATCALDGWSLRPATWLHGDGHIYLGIADRGYDLSHCTGTELWCGNAGWFPAYPLVVHLATRAGVGLTTAGVVISWAFVLATLVALWTTFLGRRADARALVVLAFAAFTPGQSFDFGVYPLSMLSFFTVLFLWRASTGRFRAAGVAGIPLVLAYPVGIAAPAAALIYLLLTGRTAPWRDRLKHVAFVCGIPAAALGLYFAFLQWQLGHWNAYFLIQRHYYHRFRSPLGPTWNAIRGLPSSGLSLGATPGYQTILVTAALALVVADLVLRRASRGPTDLLIVLWALGTWLIPSSTSHLTYSRGEAALLPMAVLVGKLPTRLGVVLAVAVVALSVPMELVLIRDLPN